ncbi:MAG: methylmalonyl-CoA epimerase [Candidatus Aminicenantales bacterium]
MGWKIDHIGIAVRDLEKSMARWQAVFPLRIKRVEMLQERGVKLAQLDLEAGPSVELIAAYGGDSSIEKFIDEKGEGIHHFSFEVDDIHRSIQELKEKGIQFVEPVPVQGAEGSSIAFIHPRNLNGVLIELKEKRDKD